MIATLSSFTPVSDSTDSTYYYSISNSEHTAPEFLPGFYLLRYVDRYASTDEIYKLIHAAEMRCRDLSGLYRTPRKQFPLRAFQAPRVIRQPCWSARRWRSVT